MSHICQRAELDLLQLGACHIGGMHVTYMSYRAHGCNLVVAAAAAVVAVSAAVGVVVVVVVVEVVVVVLLLYRMLQIGACHMSHIRCHMSHGCVNIRRRWRRRFTTMVRFSGRRVWRGGFTPRGVTSS
jgi:hypothetical protein